MKGDQKENTQNALDVQSVETSDLDALASKIESYYKQDSTVKTQLSWHWERNHLFLDGRHWIVFDGERETGGLWKRLSVSKANEFLPRPVTNYIFDVYQTLKSYVIKNKPRSTVRPNTSSHRDKMAAKIAELCIESNYERLKEHYNYEYAASVMVTYGTVFKKDYWDTSSAAGMVKVPKMREEPQVDPMSGQVIGMHEVPELDPISGEPVFDLIPLGDVNTDVVEPYRIAIDPSVNDLHKIRWIMEYSIQPLSWIRETYSKEGDGYTGLAAEIKEDTQLSGSMRRFYNLKSSSGIKSIAGTIEGTGGDDSLTNAAVVKEYYEAPTAKYPKGRMVVVCSGKTLYAGDSPFEGPELGDWHPYSECRWEVVPGRFWGKSPLDSVVDIQKQVNSIDAVITLTRKTVAVPQKLVPLSSGIAPGSWTGRPGQMISYRDAGGNPPSIIPGQGVDATVFQERSQRVEDIKNISGAIDILKGDRPPGVTAASALNLLYEVGTGKLFPVLDRWKAFVESSQKKQLKITSKRYKEPRPDFINMLVQKNRDLSKEDINKFIGADLYDNCNVIVEAGSNIPKLQAAKQAALQEAAQAGVLGLEKPANRAEYQRQMGIQGFDNDVGPDIKRAEWENSLLDNIEITPDKKPIVLFVDDDDIHMEVLARRMKEPSFVDAPQSVQMAYTQHYQEHQTQKSQKQQQAAMEALASGQPPMPHQSAADQMSPTRPAGKGPTKEVRNALHGDALVPAQIGGQP